MSMSLPHWFLGIAAAVSLALLTVLSLPNVSAQAPSGPPAFLGGTAWVDGQLAPPGTTIIAVQGNTELGRGVVEDDGKFKPFQIRKPPAGNLIYFVVGGARVPGEESWRSGLLRADLELRAGSVSQDSHADADDAGNISPWTSWRTGAGRTDGTSGTARRCWPSRSSRTVR